MDFLDIAGDNKQVKIDHSDFISHMDSKIEWAKTVLGHDVKAFIMTVPKFKEWLDFCEEKDLNYMEYKDRPIIIDKEEYSLNILAITIKNLR